MNDSDQVNFSSPDGIQSDRGADESADPVPTCVGCRREIPDVYFESNGQILCETCGDLLHESQTGGSRTRRFVRAGLLGAGASVVGFGIYYGILKLTGMEIGLISIVVGLMVGGAVRKGSDGRGGWFYQAMAMFLTYTAIVASYAAIVIPAVIAKGPPPAANPAEPNGAAVAPAPNNANPPAPAPAKMPLIVLIGKLLFYLVMVIGFLYAVPIMSGFEQPIGLLIIGFAFWEAWKINRKTRIEINGPYAVGNSNATPAPA